MILSSVKYLLKKAVRELLVNKQNCKRLKNKNFSVIASNCNGGLILHDLHLQFRSPTVNLWFEPSDYLFFLQNLEKCLNSELSFSDELEKINGYPVGILMGRVKVYFQHYQSREDAESRWRERSQRVDFDNLFIMFTDRDGCTYSDMQMFDELPYIHKVIFTKKAYPEIKSAFYIKGFEDMDNVGICSDYCNRLYAKKYYDQFPYVDWFNGSLD